jgi:O-antigen/teichoic acid export membrane protein
MKTSEIDKFTPPDGGRSRLSNNFLWLSWSGIVSIANSVLVWIFIARFRSVEEVGQFTIVMGLYALFFNVVSLGLYPYLVNEISRRISTESEQNVRVFIGSAALFLLISGIISSLLMTGSGFVFSGSSPAFVDTLILGLAIIPSGLIALCEAIAVANGRGRLVAAVATVENSLRTVIPIALIWEGYSVFAICVSFVAVRFIALGVYLIFGRSILPKFAYRRAEIDQIANVTPTFAATTVVSAMNWQAPGIMLGYQSTAASLA